MQRRLFSSLFCIRLNTINKRFKELVQQFLALSSIKSQQCYCLYYKLCRVLMQILRLNAKLWPPGPISHNFRVLGDSQKLGQWNDLNLSLFKCIVVGIFQELGLSSVWQRNSEMDAPASRSRFLLPFQLRRSSSAGETDAPARQGAEFSTLTGVGIPFQLPQVLDWLLQRTLSVVLRI